MNVLREDFLVDWATGRLGIRKNDASFLQHGGINIVLNVDSFEDVTHLYPFLPLRIAGRRATVGSLSDVILKGATPKGILLAVRLSKTFSLEAFQEFYEGVIEAARKYNISILGGDTDVSEGGGLRVDVVAVGVAEGKIVNRWGAEPGDLLAISGKVGLSAVLYNFATHKAIKCPITRDVIEEYGWGQLPELTAWLNLKEFVHAAIDNSDGIALSLHYLSEASGVKIVISRLPLHPIVEECIPSERVLEEVLYASGEDYNFIFAVPEDAALKVNEIGGTIIGRVEEGGGVEFEDGREVERKGWVGGAGYEKRR
jgi:thiamine-monophosphate kinase